MSGSLDKTIKVWNIQERREEFPLHSDLVRSVAISSDSNYIISRSMDNIIKVWNIQERREEFALRGHDSYICNIEFSSNFKYIVSGSPYNILKVWDIQGEELSTISSIAISSNCKYIVTSDKLFKVWKEKLSLNGHKTPIKIVKISSDGNLIASVSKDRELKVWSVHKRSELLNLFDYFMDEQKVAISSNGYTTVEANGNSLEVTIVL